MYDIDFGRNNLFLYEHDLQIDKAIYSIYRVWLAVAAVLSLKFARTINMALSIAEFLNRPCDHFITPVLQMAIPDDYDKWVPVVLRVSTCIFLGE